ncbi:MAG: WbqC family protein [Deltaproteobacteria bacterium]
MKVAIHQPNFFPWLGYFDKISKADIFVFMDNIDYPKSGNTMSSWTNRVKLMINGKPNWIRCPVIREHGRQLIKDIEIDNTINWRQKLFKTIEYNYKKSFYYNQVIDWYNHILNKDFNSLAEYNMANINQICNRLNLNSSFVLQSELNISESITSTDLLIEIVKSVGGDSYICGNGASGYQEDEKFSEAGIKLIYQNFCHPVYSQLKSENFIAGLSIIDMLFNCGFQNTKDLLKCK